MKIRFYTDRIAAPTVADFSLEVEAPWGLHQLRGRLLRSTRPETQGELVVAWPRWGTYYAHAPRDLQIAETARREIIKAWHDFLANDPRRRQAHRGDR